MLSGTALRLVLLVSCAHAMVHLYELALPSVEQQIAAEFYADEISGKRLTGLLSNSWRFTWGFGALAAGWLVDRYGGRRMLVVYLLGCALTCVAVGLSRSEVSLYLAMFMMGLFASIYHPAGLALISHETTAKNRPHALGIHGIFGSFGIGSAPLVAVVFLMSGYDWREFYWALALAGLLLSLVFVFKAVSERAADRTTPVDAEPEDQEAMWLSYFVLIVLGMLQGFVYAGVMSFLPRYLSSSSLSTETLTGVGFVSEMLTSGVEKESFGKIFATVVLLIGCVGQYLAGRFGRPDALEKQLTGIMFASVPFLFWMAVAQSGDRLIAAGLFALVHFMTQPLYNSLIAKYTPAARRSLCYGLSFAMGFGVGGVGALFVGFSTSQLITYGTLAGMSLGSGILGVFLWNHNRLRAPAQ